MRNKLFELFICMLLMGTFFVVNLDMVSADQYGDYTYTVSNGEATITGYIGAGGAITIPSPLGGYPTVAIQGGAFNSVNGHLITSVIIPDSVTRIWDEAFDFCSSLTSVIIGNGVTIIGSSAFSYCDNLTNVTIGNNVTILEHNAFYRDLSLTSVIIPNSVTTIENLSFASCHGLTSVTIGSGVTTMENSIFDHCTELRSIIFLGLVAPTSVGAGLIDNTTSEIRGHAYATSNFPPPGSVWNGLTMGTVIGGENKPPIADFNWSPSNFTLNQTITFNASASYDLNGSLTLYEWDWNNDGVYDEFHTAPLTIHSWSQVGNYPVTIRVTDKDGATNTKTITVPVSGENQSPEPKTPGYELIIVIGAIALVFIWRQKSKK